MHINAIGANFPQKHELEAQAVRKCDLVTADSRAQSQLESGDLIQMYGDDDRRWREVVELAEVISGTVKGRTSETQITLFKSNGVTTEDIVVAGIIYELARQRGMGRDVPMWQKDARPVVERGI